MPHIYKKNHPVATLKQVVNVFDLGYLGVEKDFPAEKKLHYPYRKKRNPELSQEEKETTSHSKRRIVIEHTIICRLKKYKIMIDVFRNKLRECDEVSDMVSGLLNYMIMNHYHY